MARPPSRRTAQDPQTQLTVASAQFELGEYELAAEGFSKVKDLSVDNLRDYAVCLGRLGQIDQAEQVLESLSGKGAHPDVTTYVQGEVSFARKDYLAAETAFLSALEQSRTSALTRRCYLSLGDLYRDCAALARVNESPIPPSGYQIRRAALRRRGAGGAALRQRTVGDVGAGLF